MSSGAQPRCIIESPPAIAFIGSTRVLAIAEFFRGLVNPALHMSSSRMPRLWSLVRSRLHFVITLCLAAPGCGAIAAPTAADFARLPDFFNPQLSPDGKKVAFARREPKSTTVLVRDIESDKSTRLAHTLPPARPAYGMRAGIRDYCWLTPSRMLFRTESSFIDDSGIELPWAATSLPSPFVRNAENGLASGPQPSPSTGYYSFHIPVWGWFASDLNGARRVELPGFTKDDAALGSAPFYWDAETLTVSVQAPGSVLLHFQRTRWSGHPNLGRFDLLKRKTDVIAENPGDIERWIIDHQEHAVLGVSTHRGTTWLWERSSEGRWNRQHDLNLAPDDVRFHRVDENQHLLYASRPSPNGRWALYGYNLEKQEWAEPQVQNSDYDVTPGDAPILYAEVDLTAPVFSVRKPDLLGVRVMAEGPRQVWFDPRFVAAQQTIDRLRPGLVNCIVGMDDKEERLLVFSWSARDPGDYGIFDSQTNKFTPLAQRMPWIKPAEMGETFPFSFRAASGVTLHGYITKPPDAKTAPVPLVVLLREQPWQRDIWGFDPWVQFLATRGYAVLQVNYRGSFGYGPAFHALGKDALAGTLHDDVEVAVQWAVRAKIADAKRVAVVGRGFGGTAALLALARATSPFRCGVAIGAVSDWAAALGGRRSAARKYWIESVKAFSGELNDQELARISPGRHAAEIRAPVLLAQAEAASPVPIAEARAMEQALKKAGRTAETFFSPPRDPERDTAELMERVQAFLGAQL